MEPSDSGVIGADFDIDDDPNKFLDSSVTKFASEVIKFQKVFSGFRIIFDDCNTYYHFNFSASSSTQ